MVSKMFQNEKHTLLGYLAVILNYLKAPCDLHNYIYIDLSPMTCNVSESVTKIIKLTILPLSAFRYDWLLSNN